MNPTRLRLLVGVAVVVGVLTWAVLTVLDAWRGGFPAIGWPTPATVAVLDVALAATVLAIRPRLLRRPGAKPLNPLLAARFAALALACSRVGAALVGGYTGFAVALVGVLDTSYGRERAIYAGLTVVASLVLVVLALVLERACRVHEPGPDENGGLGSAA